MMRAPSGIASPARPSGYPPPVKRSWLERTQAAAVDSDGAATIVRSTHERIDGGGYPDGLSAGEIPLGARIIAVCDAYDAMVSNRPYRAAMEPAAALEELRRCAGTQFDPDAVRAFCTAVERALAPV